MISITGPNVRIDADTLVRQSLRLKSPKLVMLAAQRNLMSNDSDSDEWDAEDDHPSPASPSLPSRRPRLPPTPQLMPPTPPPMPPTPQPMPPTTPPLPPSIPRYAHTPLPKYSPETSHSIPPPPSQTIPSKIHEEIKRSCMPDEELLEFQRIEQSFAQNRDQPSLVVRRKKCFENLIIALNTSNNIRHSTFLTDKN